jgi:hypothetical protein
VADAVRPHSDAVRRLPDAATAPSVPVVDACRDQVLDDPEVAYAEATPRQGVEAVVIRCDEPGGVNAMADELRWAKAVEPMRAPNPNNLGEFVAVLERLTGLAGQWSEVLEGLRGSARQYGGPAAGISFEVACRRVEQAFLELEIALRDTRSAADHIG